MFTQNAESPNCRTKNNRGLCRKLSVQAPNSCKLNRLITTASLQLHYGRGQGISISQSSARRPKSRMFTNLWYSASTSSPAMLATEGTGQ